MEHESPAEQPGIDHSNNPLQGITLKQILTELVDDLGWEKLGIYINIRCFQNNPSIKSSLAFLRKTPWARTKVENLYLTLKARAENYKKS
jgi:uncharacterized protein (DUF2132 family)